MANKNIFKIHISKPCCLLEIVHVMGSWATLKIRRSKVHFAIDILTLKQVLEFLGISSPCQLHGNSSPSVVYPVEMDRPLRAKS